MANEKLIYASSARKAILKADPKLAYVIDNVPAADAVEVVHGRWLNGTKSFRSGSIIAGYCCSACNEFSVRNSNYCPNCGAKMDGGDEDD